MQKHLEGYVMKHPIPPELSKKCKEILEEAREDDKLASKLILDSIERIYKSKK